MTSASGRVPRVAPPRPLPAAGTPLALSRPGSFSGPHRVRTGSARGCETTGFSDRGVVEPYGFPHGYRGQKVLASKVLIGYDSRASLSQGAAGFRLARLGADRLVGSRRDVASDTLSSSEWRGSPSVSYAGLTASTCGVEEGVGEGRRMAARKDEAIASSSSSRASRAAAISG